MPQHRAWRRPEANDWRSIRSSHIRGRRPFTIAASLTERCSPTPPYQIIADEIFLGEQRPADLTTFVLHVDGATGGEAVERECDFNKT